MPESQLFIALKKKLASPSLTDDECASLADIFMESDVNVKDFSFTNWIQKVRSFLGIKTKESLTPEERILLQKEILDAFVRNNKDPLGLIDDNFTNSDELRNHVDVFKKKVNPMTGTSASSMTSPSATPASSLTSGTGASPTPTTTTPPSTSTTPEDPAILFAQNIEKNINQIITNIANIKNKFPFVGREVQIELEKQLQIAKETLESININNVIKQLTDLNTSPVLPPAILNTEIKNILTPVEQALKKAQNAESTVKKLPRDSYIERRYNQQQLKVTPLQAAYNTAKGARDNLHSIHYAFLGSKRTEIFAADERLAKAVKALAEPKDELKRLELAKKRYDKENLDWNLKKIEIETFAKEYETAKKDLAALQASSSSDQTALQEQSDKVQKTKEKLEEAKIQQKNIENSILMLSRSFGSEGEGKERVWVPQKNILGFELSVVQQNDIGHHITHAREDSRSTINTGGANTDTYYLKVPLNEGEALLAARKNEDGSTSRVVQMKEMIRDASQPKKGLSDDDAMLMAVMAVLNRKKDKPLVLTGPADDVKKMHAALLWLKRQTAETLLNKLGDMVGGKISHLNLENLKIEAAFGPEKASRFGFQSQAAMDQTFIDQYYKEHSNYNAMKENLKDLKAEHGKIKDIEAEKMINPTPRPK